MSNRTWDDYCSGFEEFVSETGDVYECKKKARCEYRNECPPCPPCTPVPECVTTEAPPPPEVPPEKPPEPWGAYLYDEEIGVTGFDKPPGNEELIKINDEYEDEENNTWFSKPPANPPPEKVLGCTDPTATNYNPNATEDDGTCTYTPPPPPDIPGCMDPNATNYNPSATVDDGTCTYPPPPVPGCMDPEAENYNPDATEDDGTCTYAPPPVPGCMDPSATNYNPLATVDDGSCTYAVPGCMDPTAENYNPMATVDDGTCTYAPVEVPGCTDPAAENYNPDATVDDGTCTYAPTPSGPTGYSQPYTIITTYPAQQEMFNQLNIKSGARQDPDGIDWLAGSVHWTNSEWDGTVFDPFNKTKEEICAFLRPSHGYVTRGIREHFYNINPFADNSNPTPAEIDNWNVEVIRHFRRMFGISTPVIPDARLYLECRWSDERKWTTAWDTKYPDGVVGTASGPCFNTSGTPVDTAGGHCGESFFPDAADRAVYISQPPYNNDTTKYPELADYNARFSQTSGNNAVNAGINWSIRLAWIITQWMCNEGTTGHAGPYLGRERFGCSWFYTGGATTNYRAKWR